MDKFLAPVDEDEINTGVTQLTAQILSTNSNSLNKVIFSGILLVNTNFQLHVEFIEIVQF